MSMSNASGLLCPDKRGGRRCICHGTFMTMTHGSGWIHPIEEIDHPATSWNQGGIYVSEKDIFPGVTLEAGDSVLFFLYVDGKGLGAENVVQVWHEQARAMKVAMDTATARSLASAFLAVSSVVQASNPVLQTTVLSELLDFASFPDNDVCFTEDNDFQDNEDARATKISLVDSLLDNEPKSFPSVGSALHATGNCKMCSFFPKGICTSGSACEFCHYEHDTKPRPARNKGKRVRDRQKAHLARFAAEGAATPPGTPPREEPMKCEISPFLMSISKEPGCIPGSQRSPSTCGSTDEGSCGDTSDSSSWGSPPLAVREPVFSPPPGLAPPLPTFSPPQMLAFLSERKVHDERALTAKIAVRDSCMAVREKSTR